MVASADVYGGTYGLLTEELPRFGISTTMADMRDPSSYEAAIQENTKILYIETLTNPVLKVCDIEAMADVAKRHNLLLIIDNTFASPWGCKPLAMGVDLVIHSTTKYLGGHSDIIGGAVVGSNAGELLGEIGLAIEMGCDAEDLALTIHAHPTLHESIGLAAELFEGSITDLPNPKAKK